jgi:[ribosomal protein S5]-alanine N-acetyltransferase
MAGKIRRLETERLTLRRFTPSDGPAVHLYMGDPIVTRWLPQGRLDEAAAQAFADRQAGGRATALAVVERASGALIGHTDFHTWFGPDTWEIGWAIGRPHQGRGYATEAAGALTAHAFETLRGHRVVATCQPENPASWRVMEKLGMRREAHFRQHIHREGGAWWDEYFYALLAEEYFARAERPADPRPA